jgi:hypothetical protein
MFRDFLGRDAEAEAPSPAGPPVPTRGVPVPAAAGRVLDSAPDGGRLDYQLPDGRPAAFVLGGVFQSGLQVPCRIGRLGGSGGEVSGTYAFCRQGDQWYAMPPVVVSGF